MRLLGAVTILLAMLVQSTAPFAMPGMAGMPDPGAGHHLSMDTPPCHGDAGADTPDPSDHCCLDYCQCGATCSGIQVLPSRLPDTRPTATVQGMSVAPAPLTAHISPPLRPPTSRFAD